MTINSVDPSPGTSSPIMPFSGKRLVASALCAVALILSVYPAAAQSSDPKNTDQQRPAPAGDAAKEGQKKVDVFAEAAEHLSGAAGYPECVWLGSRVVSLLWRDDLDTAFRHLDLYDRFGCPGGHVQVTFRCLVQQGNIDPKVPESLNGRVHACWINPTNPAPVSPSAAASTGTSGR